MKQASNMFHANPKEKKHLTNTATVFLETNVIYI